MAQVPAVFQSLEGLQQLSHCGGCGYGSCPVGIDIDIQAVCPQILQFIMGQGTLRLARRSIGIGHRPRDTRQPCAHRNHARHASDNLHGTSSLKTHWPGPNRTEPRPPMYVVFVGWHLAQHQAQQTGIASVISPAQHYRAGHYELFSSGRVIGRPSCVSSSAAAEGSDSDPDLRRAQWIWTSILSVVQTGDGAVYGDTGDTCTM